MDFLIGFLKTIPLDIHDYAFAIFLLVVISKGLMFTYQATKITDVDEIHKYTAKHHRFLTIVVAVYAGTVIGSIITLLEGMRRVVQSGGY